MEASPTYFEGVLKTLSTDQKERIRTTDYEYIYFHVSIFNAGATVYIDTFNDIPDESDWNDQYFVLPTSEVIECLDKYNL